MDSNFSDNMFPIKGYFYTLNLEKSGTGFIGDDKACKIYGIGTTILKMFNDREFILHNVRYIP